METKLRTSATEEPEVSRILKSRKGRVGKKFTDANQQDSCKEKDEANEKVVKSLKFKGLV